MNPRRTFVRQLGWLVVGAASGGRCWTRLFCSEAHAEDTLFSVGKFSLRLSDYPPLLSDNGSVYFSIPGVPDIIVTRLRGNEFHAVSSVCTHQSCTVGLYDADEAAMVCPCHRSAFTPAGEVLHGFAPRPLLAFPTTFDGQENLSIEVSKYGFAIQPTPEVITASGGRRLGIRFDTEFPARYEVRFRTGLETSIDDAVPVAYATTEDGPLVTDLFNGTGNPETLWVELVGRSGFFVVGRYRMLGG